MSASYQHTTRLTAGIAGAHSDKFKSSDSLLGSKHANSTTHSSHVLSSPAAGRLQHAAAADSSLQRSISQKLAAWSTSSSTAGLKASTGPKLSSGLFKPAPSSSTFDSSSTRDGSGGTSSSTGTGTHGRAVSVPRSCTGVFDAARGSQSSPHSHTNAPPGSSRSSSTGRSSGRLGQPGSPASPADISSRAAVPGRARVVLGRVLHPSSTTDSALKPSPPGGLGSRSSSTELQAPCNATGGHSAQHSTMASAVSASAAAAKLAAAGTSSSLQRANSTGTAGAAGRSQQQQQQPLHKEPQMPDSLSAIARSPRLHAAGTAAAKTHALGVSSLGAARAPPAAAASSGAHSHSLQPGSDGSTYLSRLKDRQRAATADAATSRSSTRGGGSSYVSASSVAAAVRRVSSASAATTTTSSSKQTALDTLRASSMRARAPALVVSTAVSKGRVQAGGMDCLDTSSRPRAGAVTGNSSSRAIAEDQRSALPDQAATRQASDSSSMASLTALLQRVNSRRQDAAVDVHARQEQPPGQHAVQPQQEATSPQQPGGQPQQQQQVEQRHQQLQGSGAVGPVAAGRRATDGDPGPGERLEFPALQLQQPAALRSQSGSQLEARTSNNYIDMARSGTSGGGQPHHQQQEQQPSEQQPPQQRQQYHRQRYQQQAHQPDQHQLLQQQRGGDIGHMTAALQRHGAAAAAAAAHGAVPTYRPGSLAGSGRSSSFGGGSDSGVPVYRPPYVPPQAAASRDQGGSSVHTHAAIQPSVAGVAPVTGAAYRRSTSSGWHTISPADDTSGHHSTSGIAQPGRGLQQQQQRVQEREQRGSSSSSNGDQQQQRFLISTQPMGEVSPDDSDVLAAERRDQAAAAAAAAAADAAARHAFLNSSLSSGSWCSDQDTSPAKAAAGAWSASQTQALGSSSGSSAQRQAHVQWQASFGRPQASSGADGTASADLTAIAAAGARKVLYSSRCDSSRHGAGAAPLDAGAASESDSDVSEMSCSSLDSGSSSSSVAVTVNVRAAGYAGQQQAAAFPQYPQAGRRSTAVQLEAYSSSGTGTGYGSRSGSVGSPAAHSLVPPVSAAVVGTVPVKAYARSLASQRGAGLPRGCCGLRNSGNTCYQNSALQLLGCVPELVGALLGQQAVPLFLGAATDAANNRSKASMHNALLDAAAAAQDGIDWLPNAAVGPALQALMCEMWGFQPPQQRRPRGSPGPQRQQHHPQGVSQCMEALRAAMAELDPRWDDGDQWDCQEFCLALLQAVHNDSNRVRGRPQYRELKLQGCEAQQAAEAAAYARSWEDSVVLDIFSWQLQSTMTCCCCGKRSHAFDSAQELLVAIPAGSEEVTVQECLSRTTFSSEKMVGEEGYKCESCKALREATKQLQLFSYPRMLLLGLKRFETRGGSKGGNKSCELYSSRKVSTRVRLDARERLDLGPFCNPEGLKAAAAAGQPPPLYELIAVADHTGYIHGGHYTARGRCLLEGSWMEFNDSLVLATDAPSGSTREAYFLLYRLVA